MRISGGRQYHFIHTPNIGNCNACLCCNIQEEKFDIISLPLTLSVPESIKTFLGPEGLTGANRWFYPACNDLTNSTNEIKFIKVGTIAIFQLQRYIMFKGYPIKDNRKEKCSSDPLKVSVVCENTVSFSASFLLQATINQPVPCKPGITGPLKGTTKPING